MAAFRIFLVAFEGLRVLITSVLAYTVYHIVLDLIVWSFFQKKEEGLIVGCYDRALQMFVLDLIVWYPFVSLVADEISINCITSFFPYHAVIDLIVLI